MRFLEFDNRTQSTAKWAHEFNLPAKLIGRRLAAGWSVADALTTPTDESNRGARMIECNGVVKSIHAWAAASGLKVQMIHARLAAGWPAERAVSAPSGGGELVEHNGKMQSVAAHARDAGRVPSLVVARVKLLGWTMERALSEPARPKGKTGERKHPSAGNLSARRLKRMVGFRERPADGRCYCCRRAFGAENLVPDHDHLTDEFRGWLCRACNAGIGMLGDQADAPGLRNALAYLGLEPWDVPPPGDYVSR